MCHFLIHPLWESHSVSVLTLSVMELFIFIVFQHLMEVQSYSKWCLLFNFDKILYIQYTYFAKSIGSPPSNERLDYFSNFHEYKSLSLSI